MVTDNCNSGQPVAAATVQTATSRISNDVQTAILGFPVVGSVGQPDSTTGVTTQAPKDDKLWIIGAVLGPVAFVLLLVGLFLYLHYKCRPRARNVGRAQVRFRYECSESSTTSLSLPF